MATPEWIDFFDDDLDGWLDDEPVNINPGYDALDLFETVTAIPGVPKAGYGSWHDDDGFSAESDAAYFIDGPYLDRPSLN